jgi:hypothetical protein
MFSFIDLKVNFTIPYSYMRRESHLQKKKKEMYFSNV